MRFPKPSLVTLGNNFAPGLGMLSHIGALRGYGNLMFMKRAKKINPKDGALKRRSTKKRRSSHKMSNIWRNLS